VLCSNSCPITLATYPYVIVRLARFCRRRGSYRLVRLAAKFGPEIDMESLLARLAGDCEHWRPRHPTKEGCGAHFSDLGSGRPPDLPPGVVPMRRLVKR
jgi:hypothetical protein